MEQDKLKAFLIPIFVCLLVFVGAFYGIQKVIALNTEYGSLSTDVANKQSSLEEKKQKLENFKKEASQAEAASTAGDNTKPFYKPVMSGLDTEAVIAGEFTEILQLIRNSKIKVRSIKYDYKPDDPFLNSNTGYNVARLNMEMVSNYTNYNNFLKSLYKHDHFLDIESVEIVPYKKNKTYLLINFKLKLYAKS